MKMKQNVPEAAVYCRIGKEESETEGKSPVRHPLMKEQRIKLLHNDLKEEGRLIGYGKPRT